MSSEYLPVTFIIKPRYSGLTHQNVQKQLDFVEGSASRRVSESGFSWCWGPKLFTITNASVTDNGGGLIRITSNAHGLTNGTRVQITAKLDTTPTFPTNITSGTNYWVINTAANTFELSATPGGAGLAFVAAGSGTFIIAAFGVSGIVGVINAIKKIPQWRPIAIYNSDTNNHFIKLDTVSPMAAPTGPTDGFAVPPGLTIISSGPNEYVISDSATVYAFVAEDKIIAAR